MCTSSMRYTLKQPARPGAYCAFDHLAHVVHTGVAGGVDLEQIRRNDPVHLSAHGTHLATGVRGLSCRRLSDLAKMRARWWSCTPRVPVKEGVVHRPRVERWSGRARRSRPTSSGESLGAPLRANLVRRRLPRISPVAPRVRGKRRRASAKRGRGEGGNLLPAAPRHPESPLPLLPSGPGGGLRAIVAQRGPTGRHRRRRRTSAARIEWRRAGFNPRSARPGALQPPGHLSRPGTRFFRPEAVRVRGCDRPSDREGALMIAARRPRHKDACGLQRSDGPCVLSGCSQPGLAVGIVLVLPDRHVRHLVDDPAAGGEGGVAMVCADADPYREARRSQATPRDARRRHARWRSAPRLRRRYAGPHRASGAAGLVGRALHHAPGVPFAHPALREADAGAREDGAARKCGDVEGASHSSNRWPGLGLPTPAAGNTISSPSCRRCSPGGEGAVHGDAQGAPERRGKRWRAANSAYRARAGRSHQCPQSPLEHPAASPSAK